MTKAFDQVKHSTLFWKLMEKGLPSIYIRLLLIMYEQQQANVRWSNILSKHFQLRTELNKGPFCPLYYTAFISIVFLTFLGKGKQVVG